jgi:PleD family two-component response regulator
MLSREKKKILAVMDDLFFTVKVHDAAKKAQMEVEFLRSGADVIEKAKERPALIIFDLNFSKVRPLDLIRSLKSSPELKGISLIGYLSHLQADLKVKAQDAGANMVLARSAFSRNLTQILKRHAEVFQ